MVFFKEVWPWNEFEMFFVLFSTIRLKDEVNFLIREFLEVFFFPGTLRDIGIECRRVAIDWRRIL